MAEVEYEPGLFGHFNVSRKLVSSSRWVRGSPAAIKLMVYMLERASNPMNPYPGDIRETGNALAHFSGMKDPPGLCEAALSELLAKDPESQGGKSGGAFLEELTSDGRLVGYRVLNFAEYNPEAMVRSIGKQKARAQRRAIRAACVRWDKPCDYPECKGTPEFQVGERYYCETHSETARTIIRDVSAETDDET